MKTTLPKVLSPTSLRITCVLRGHVFTCKHSQPYSCTRCSQRHQSLIATFRPKPSKTSPNPKILDRGNRSPCRPRCVILTRDAKTYHPAWSARSSPCPQRALHGAVPQPCPRPRRSVAGHTASTRAGRAPSRLSGLLARSGKGPAGRGETRALSERSSNSEQ